jgi:NAD(P)-dependent dehydrogenase (short-subunit alcohol dehydrogenase family)
VAGRTIVITGASDGIGAAAARRLARSGDTVVVVGRSEPKTTAVADDLAAEALVADFADLSQVRALAKSLLERYPRIDVLANNAGGMTMGRETTVDGLEKTFQVNYLAPFLLTTVLLDRLVESAATVINTTSSSHKLLLRRVSVEDLQNTGRYRPSAAYARSKLAVVAFTTELHRRHHRDGIWTAAFHPGYINSNFGHASGSRMLAFMEKHTPMPHFIPPAEQGCEQLVWLASGTRDGQWQSGQYYSRHKLAKANRQAYDPVFAADLWDRSVAMVSG